MYEVSIKHKIYHLRAKSPLNAACLAFELFLSAEKEQASVPLVLSVKDSENGRETLIFTPVVLADLGMHKESSKMMKQVARIIKQ